MNIEEITNLVEMLLNKRLYNLLLTTNGIDLKWKAGKGLVVSSGSVSFIVYPVA